MRLKSVVGGWLVALLALAGCGKETSSNVEEPSAASQISVDELIDSLARLYSTGQRYYDQATIELSYREDGRKVSDKADIAVSFARPNRLAVRAYKTLVVCDGERFRARVRDEATNDLDGQVVDRPAPTRITRNDLTSDKLLLRQLSSAVTAGETATLPPQLELLLGEADWSLLRDPTHTRRIAGEEMISGTTCLRVEIGTPKGVYELWIDPAYYTLLQMSFPRESLLPELANNERLKDVRLVARFHDAFVDSPVQRPRIRGQFPEGGRRVRYFVPPPQPLPSELFGKAAGKFSFTSLSGEVVSSDSLQGRPAVLLWFQEHPACELALKQLDQVFRKLQKSESEPGREPAVAFYGICTEPSSVSATQIEALAKLWDVSLPIVRDLNAHGRDLFQFQGSPALLVLNANGVVQIVEVGANPQLSEELPAILERLKAGEDIAADVLAKDKAERDRYERELAIASGEAPAAVAADATAEKTATTSGAPAPAPQDGSSPGATAYAAAAPTQRLKAERRWTLNQLPAPGPIVAASASAASGNAQFFVLSAGRTLVQVSASGKEIARRELPIPDGTVASIVSRWAEANTAERWAIAGPTLPEVLILDAQFQVVGRVARAKSNNAPGAAVEVAWTDIEGDGRPELLVLDAPAGGAAGKLSLFDASGERLRADPGGRLDKSPTGSPLEFSARWLATASPVAPMSAAYASNNAGPQPWIAWFGDDQTRPTRIGVDGRLSPPIDIGSWRLQRAFVASFPPESASKAAAIAVSDTSRPALVAFNVQLKENWNYPLPAAAGELPSEPIRSALLFVEREPFWVLAGADGTVHLISADGSFSDYFSVGEPITGLTTVRYDGNALVVVATAREVTAWSFERP